MNQWMVTKKAPLNKLQFTLVYLLLGVWFIERLMRSYNREGFLPITLLPGNYQMRAKKHDSPFL